MSRKRGSRFRKAIDAQEQVEGLEQAQRDSRQKTTGKLINRTDKSTQRFSNFTKKLRTRVEVKEGFTEEE